MAKETASSRAQRAYLRKDVLYSTEHVDNVVDVVENVVDVVARLAPRTKLRRRRRRRP